LNLDAGASLALAEASMVGDPARGFVIASVAAEIEKVKRWDRAGGPIRAERRLLLPPCAFDGIIVGGKPKSSVAHHLGLVRLSVLEEDVMKRKPRYEPVLSDEELEALGQRVTEALKAHVRHAQDRQEALLRLLKEKGPEQFTWWLSGAMQGYGDIEFAPEPRFHPELGEKLDRLRGSGWPVDDLRGSRVGRICEAPRLRFELPLDANLKEYLRAMQVYQEYFQSLERQNLLVAYWADEHGRGRTYTELAKELNEAIKAWAQGEATSLDCLGLHNFLKAKRYTPENYKFYSDERVRRAVKYFVTRK